MGGCNSRRDFDRWEPAITLPARIDPADRATLQPRAFGAGHVAVRHDGTTRLQDLRQSGCTKVLLPRTHCDHVEAITVNTAGGITGGDRIDLSIEVGASAELTISTQAAERAYRAQPGEIGAVTTRVTAGDDAVVHWLPQELILFENSALHRRLEIDLAPTARVLMCEPVVFGRAAHNERLTAVQFRDRITLRRGCRPLYLDGLDLSGDVAAHLGRAATGAGAGAMASVVYAGPDAARHLGPIRDRLPDTAGASLLADDLLVLRFLSCDSYALRRALVPVLERLAARPLPKTWRL